jgi:tRNA threonylcarbamoyladenosine biosynthesis protein TsaB
LILLSSALELIRNDIIMNILIVDAASNEIFLMLIIDKNIYTRRHENSKINYEKLIVLVNNFLMLNKSSLNKIKTIYVNRGPGSFAGIRNSIAMIKALFLTKKIDYYCFSFSDFDDLNKVKYRNLPQLCKKYKIKKNLINPIY